MRILCEEDVHEDERRRLTQLFTAPIAQVNLYEAKNGAILGDHFHRETDEYFYVVQGRIMYNESRILNTGDIFVVYPQENHRIECLEDVKLMSFLTRPYSKENPDIWKS